VCGAAEDEMPSQEGKITGKGFSDIVHVNVHANNGSRPDASPSFLRAANTFWDYLGSSQTKNLILGEGSEFLGMIKIPGTMSAFPGILPKIQE
jgi:hypothetical protein